MKDLELQADQAQKSKLGSLKACKLDSFTTRLAVVHRPHAQSATEQWPALVLLQPGRHKAMKSSWYNISEAEAKRLTSATPFWRCFIISIITWNSRQRHVHIIEKSMPIEVSTLVDLISGHTAERPTMFRCLHLQLVEPATTGFCFKPKT